MDIGNNLVLASKFVTIFRRGDNMVKKRLLSRRASGSHSLEFLTLLQAVAVTFVIIGRGMGDKCINIFCPPHEFPSLSMFLLIPDRSCPVFVPLFGAVLLLALMTPCHFIRCTSFHGALLIQLPSFCLRPFHFLQHQLWSTVCNQFIPVLSQR